MTHDDDPHRPRQASLPIPASWGGGVQRLPIRRGQRRLKRPRRYRGEELSSTSDKLRGFVLDGKPILRVTKAGGRRRVYFRGGEQQFEDRATLAEIMKGRGWAEYHRRLQAAPTLSAKKAIVRASRTRQQRILAGAIRRLEAGAVVAPPHVADGIRRRIRELKRTRFGSPILGETPATSAVAPHHGPAKTFATLARTTIQFRTIRRGRRTRVIPITS